MFSFAILFDRYFLYFNNNLFISVSSLPFTLIFISSIEVNMLKRRIIPIGLFK